MILALSLLLQDKWLFEDKFAAAPGKGYAWVRQDAAASKVEKGALLLKPLPGTIWEKTATQKNLLVRELPAWKPEEGSIAAEVTVTNAMGADSEQAGLMLYLDDDNYLKLCRERVGGKTQIVFARERAGAAVCPVERDDPAASHKLRIRWEGQRVSAEILPAGAPKWIAAGYCESPFPKPEGVKVALYACGAPADANRWAQFTDFRIGHPAPVE
jgi:regulation of enolase protein 1 (concanavalin A-like superfamily)